MLAASPDALAWCFLDFLRDLSSITPTFLMKFGLEPRWCHFWDIQRQLRAWQPVVRGFCPKSFFPDVIFEKFKGPCGHDNSSFGAFAPNHFCRKSFLRNLKAPAGMTTRRSGLLCQLTVVYQWHSYSTLVIVIDHSVQSSICFRNHLLGKQPHDFLVFQKTVPQVRFSILFGRNYFLNSAIRIFRRFNHTNSARRSRLKEWWPQKVS